MKKRILVMLMAVVLLLAAAPAVLAADAAAVPVGSEEALAAAVKSGAPAVKLTADIGLHEPLLLSKSIDMDLGGHTITAYYNEFSKAYDLGDDTAADDVYIGIAEGSEGMVAASIHDGAVVGNFDARPEVKEGLYAYDTMCVLSLYSGTAHLKNLKVDSPIGTMYMARGSVEGCELAVTVEITGKVTSVTDTVMTFEKNDYSITVSGSVDKIADVKMGKGTIFVYGTVGELTGTDTMGIYAYNGAKIDLIDDCDLCHIYAAGYSRAPEDSKPTLEAVGMTGDAHIGTIQDSRFVPEAEEEFGPIPAIYLVYGASVDQMKGVTINATGDALGSAIKLDAASIGGLQNTTINGCVDMEGGGEIGDMDHVTVTGLVTMSGDDMDDETGEILKSVRNSFGDITDCTFNGYVLFTNADVGKITGSKFNDSLSAVSSTMGDIVKCQFTAGATPFAFGISATGDSTLGTIQDCTVTLTGADYGYGIELYGGSCDGIVDTKVTVSGADATGIFLTDDGLIDNIEGCTVTVSGDFHESGVYGIRVTGSDVFTFDGCTVTVDARDESGEDTLSAGVCISDSILGSMSNTTVSGSTLIEDSVSGDIRGSHFDTLEIDNTVVDGSIAQNTVDEDLIVDPGSEVASIRSNEIAFMLYVCGSDEAPTSVEKIVGNKAALLWIEADYEPDGAVVSEISGNTFIYSEDDWFAFSNSGTVGLMEDNVLKGAFPWDDDGEVEVFDGLNMGVIKVLRADGELVGDESGLYSTFQDEGFTILNYLGTIEKVEKPTSPKTFPDVPADAWYADAVSFVSESGLMEGSGGLFLPDAAANRAEVATVMYRFYRSELPTGGSGFTDVPAGAWYAPYVTWAAQCQIMQGSGDGAFRPMGTITRAELAMVMWNAADQPVADESILDQYPDGASVPGWAKTAMSWAVNAGVIQGDDSGALAPAGSVQRCQIAVMLQRFVEAGYVD